jgi:dynactin-2
LQAIDEKDVYETENTGTNEPEYYEEEPENESIDRSKLNPNDAYSKFKGKYLIGNVDFSDSIGKKKCIGYNAL